MFFLSIKRALLLDSVLASLSHVELERTRRTFKVTQCLVLEYNRLVDDIVEKNLVMRS